MFDATFVHIKKMNINSNKIPIRIIVGVGLIEKNGVAVFSGIDF